MRNEKVSKTKKQKDEKTEKIRFPQIEIINFFIISKMIFLKP